MTRSANGSRCLLYRNVFWTAAAGTLALAALLALLLLMSWRSAERLQPLERSVERLVQLERRLTRVAEAGSLAIQERIETKAQQRDLSWPTSRMGHARAVGEAGRRASAGPADATFKVAATGSIPSEPLAEAALPGPAAAVSDGPGRALPRDIAPAQMAELGRAMHEELGSQRALLADLTRASRQELHTALGLAGVLPLMVAAAWLLYRRQVLKPLESLGDAMTLLARRDFRTLDSAGHPPLIRPVYARFNRLAARIRDLEDAHRKREAALREELEESARTLLRQQAALARADRMAALGHLAARMAHRLRSPLSGVLVTLTNLSGEAVTPDQRRRLAMSIDALERSFRELTALTEEASPEPEPAVPLALGPLVDGLLALVERQVADGRLGCENAVPPGLAACLPAAGIRHALMALLTNAVEAQATAESKRVRVVAERRGGQLAIAVEDGGPGYPAAELKGGAQGPSDLNRRGRALGLAVVRRFAELQGGRLILANLPAGGAQATLLLPVPDGLPEERAAGERVPQGTPRTAPAGLRPVFGGDRA